jgi:hypothetical protein
MTLPFGINRAVRITLNHCGEVADAGFAMGEPSVFKPAIIQYADKAIAPATPHPNKSRDFTAAFNIGR